MNARFTDRWVREALQLEGAGAGVFPAVVTDTREMQPGALFVALAGERFDAHQMLEQAREAGAAAAVVRTGTADLPGCCFIACPIPSAPWATSRLPRAGVMPDRWWRSRDRTGRPRPRR